MFKQGLLIFDGGIGTELYKRGFYINRPFEELSISAPADVQAVHEAYIAAGAKVITTNTFSIARPHLKKFDIEDKQSLLIAAALKVANAARKDKLGVKIGFSMGPTGLLIEPLGPTSREEAREYFAEVARLAQAAEVQGDVFDLYLLETFSNISELEDAIEGVRSVDPQRPLLASITVSSKQSSFVKSFVENIGRRDDVQALGLNCSQGPSDLYTVLEKIISLVDKPIVVQPNAGLPNHVNGRYFYMSSPDYMAKYASRYVELGALGVGGCCGTGPDHIQAISRALHMSQAKRVEVSVQRSAEREKMTRPQARSWQERPESYLGQALRSSEKTGKKVISVELVSPIGPDLTKFITHIEKLENAGVSFVNVPDGARASTRVSSLHLAAAINGDPKRKIKIFPHLTTRDRNLIALQSDILGAYVNGVRDILVITGDPPKLGNNKDATAVYDIDSIGLTYLIDCLNRGVTPAGDVLGKCTNFGIGVASNPTSLNLELEIQRWKYKCESGADFAVTQPIFDPESYLQWRERNQECWRPHMVGIWPLISLRNAEFLANEVPGIKVPSAILEEMAKSHGDSQEAIKRGLDIAHSIMQKLKDTCDGFCISAPLNKTEIVVELVSR